MIEYLDRVTQGEGGSFVIFGLCMLLKVFIEIMVYFVLGIRDEMRRRRRDV